MRPDADKQLADLLATTRPKAPIFKMRDDPRRTRIGAFIRRWSLDELPQFWNVVEGRDEPGRAAPADPARGGEVRGLAPAAPGVSPGITGLWQVSGRSELGFDEQVLMDIYYIENWSLGLDLRILLRTIPAVLTGRGHLRVGSSRARRPRMARRHAPRRPPAQGRPRPRLPEPVRRRRAGAGGPARRCSRARPIYTSMYWPEKMPADYPRAGRPHVVHAATAAGHAQPPAVPAAVSAGVRELRPARLRRGHLEQLAPSARAWSRHRARCTSATA